MRHPAGVVGRVVLPGVESVQETQNAAESWAWLLRWLSLNWPRLVTAGLVGGGAIGLWRCWDWLLDREGGRYWPLLAALLPPLIPIARAYQENSPEIVKSSTVAGLLTAIALVSVYGQQRSNRDRIKTQDQLDEQAALLGRIGAGVSRIGSGVGRVEARIERVEDAVGDIATALSALAAQAEEQEDS